MLSNCLCIDLVCCFLKKKKKFRNIIRMLITFANSLDPDQARRSVEPDLVPNCLQRLSADDKSATSRQRFILAVTNETILFVLFV